MVRWLPVLAVVLMSACAGVAPVPGGDEEVNAAYYSSADDFKARVAQLQAGMPEPLVMQILGRQPHEMTRLTRQEVVQALYGPNTMQMLDGNHEREEVRAYLQSLYGYRLDFRDVDRKVGFASPIRVRTDEKGFAYTVFLVFQNGYLAEKPEMTGGVVNESSSKTFFDYLNPGTVLGRVQ